MHLGTEGSALGQQNTRKANNSLELTLFSTGEEELMHDVLHTNRVTLEQAACLKGNSMPRLKKSGASESISGLHRPIKKDVGPN